MCKSMTYADLCVNCKKEIQTVKHAMKLIILQLEHSLCFLVTVGAPLIVYVEQCATARWNSKSNCSHIHTPVASRLLVANSWIKIPVPAAARQGRKHEKCIASAHVFV